MNVWKPIALCSVAGLALSLGIQVAYADFKGDDVCKGQPHMQAAHHDLVDAYKNVHDAEHDKGGWRAPTMQAIGGAIGQLETACAAGASGGH
jgi:hypothetical protein